MNKTEILKFIGNLPALVLTTMNGDAPDTRALINIRNAGIAPHLVEFFANTNRILFITNTSSDKIKQIRANSSASLYGYDNNWTGLTLAGTIHEITDSETIDALWDDSWKNYYPDGKDGGDFSVLEFIPKNFKHYDGANGFVKTNGTVE